MENAAIVVQNEGVIDPERILQVAYSNTKAEGSSTACIIALNEKCLHAVNVGDSGFLVYRQGEITYHSLVQQHGFNCPYQLKSGNERDQPSSGKVFKVPIELGDIIVAGTDGLFDNLFESEIAELVTNGIRDGMGPQNLASTIAEYALYNSNDKYCHTPFSRASKKAGHHHHGGKIDDITVIVAYIYDSFQTVRAHHHQAGTL